MGRLLIAFVVLLCAAPASARGEWREATSDHFVIVSSGSEAQLVQMSRELEAVHWLIGQGTRVSATDNGAKVRIYLVPTIGDVRRAMGVPASSGVAGFYSPNVNGAIAVVPRDQLEFSKIVLYHEYAHHYMAQYLQAAYPPWFAEGFAEVISSSTLSRNGEITYGAVANHRAYELFDGQWVPLERMFAPRSSTDRRAGVANYGQYWLVAHYLTLSGRRRGELSAYVTALNNGSTEVESYSAFAGGISALNADARAYLGNNRFQMQRPAVPPEVLRAPAIRLMRPGEGAVTAEELQAQRSFDATGTAALNTRIAALAAQYPFEPVIPLLAARLAIQNQDFAGAIAAADRVLALDPANVRALAWKGQAMLARAQAAGDEITPALLREARVLIARANRLNPEDQVPLIAYFRSFELAGQPPSANAIDGLYKATRLVPQADDLRMTLAMALIGKRDLPMARRTLRPLALAAHRSAQQDYALQLVEWIDAGGDGNPPRYFAPVALDAS